MTVRLRTSISAYTRAVCPLLVTEPSQPRKNASGIETRQAGRRVARRVYDVLAAAPISARAVAADRLAHLASDRGMGHRGPPARATLRCTVHVCARDLLMTMHGWVWRRVLGRGTPPGGCRDKFNPRALSPAFRGDCMDFAGRHDRITVTELGSHPDPASVEESRTQMGWRETGVRPLFSQIGCAEGPLMPRCGRLPHVVLRALSGSSECACGQGVSGGFRHVYCAGVSGLGCCLGCAGERPGSIEGFGSGPV